MLSALLLGGLFAAPIATTGLFLGRWRSHRDNSAVRRLGRLLSALFATAALSAIVAMILFAVGVTRGNIEASVIGLVALSIFWIPFTLGWNALAHLCWAATTYLFVVYLVFMFWWTLASHLGIGGTFGGIVLWLLELFAAFLGCAYLWELCDTLGRAHWKRRLGESELAAFDRRWFPFVSLHVPCYNEPPDMVVETLASLQRLDYPNFEIIAIDDNTADEEMWRPVAAWCANHDVKFVHLSDWPGYKSGALNYALNHMIDDRTELIGVVDSDYQLDRSFLAKCAPLFSDSNVGFIQAPQDYRAWESAAFYRRLYYSYRYFFAVSQPSRNERDGAIFAGTMGLIRRQALEQAGGWDEWCITEDAELSLRLLRDGWSGLHVDPSLGKGIMPLTFEGLKGQRFRWCFGGIQILRRHWRSMMPGLRSDANHLDLGQRWAYLSGAIQWYGDLLGLIFFCFLIIGAANIAFGGGLLFRKLTGFLLAAIPVLVLLGLLRAIALLRRGTGASWRDAIGAFLIWQSTSLTVARASVQALFAKEAVFLRTPKVAEEGHIRDAIRSNWAECLLGLAGIAAIGGSLLRHDGYGGALIAVLLLWPTMSFLAAPVNSLSAQRAVLPADLAARRRSEHLRTGARRVTYTVGGLSLVGLGSVVAIAALSPGPSNVVPPQLVGPATGHPAHYGPQPVQTPGQARPSAPSSSTPAQKSATPSSTTPSANSGAASPSGTSGASGTSTSDSGSTSTSTSSPALAQPDTSSTAPPTSTTTPAPASSSTTSPTASSSTTSPTAGSTTSSSTPANAPTSTTTVP